MMYFYLVINAGHQTPPKNPFRKVHCFQQKGEITGYVRAKSQESEGKTQWPSFLFVLTKGHIWKK